MGFVGRSMTVKRCGGGAEMRGAFAELPLATIHSETRLAL